MKNNKIKYPKNQKPLLTQYDENDIPRFLITRNQVNEYILYSIDNNGKLIKIKQANEPTKFDNIIKKGWLNISGHKDYRRELYRKEKGRYDVTYQSTSKYNKESKYLGSHQASAKEISDMLAKSKRWMCSYT